MKKILLTVLAAAALTFSGCNTSDSDVISGSNYPKELSDEELAKEPVFTIVDQQPEYSGGILAMYKFLAKNQSNIPPKTPKTGFRAKCT